jgi:methyl-accepting chemotaxis protein
MPALETQDSVPHRSAGDGWFADKPIRAKILGGAVVAVATALIVAVTGLVSLINQQSTAERTEREINALKTDLSDMETNFWNALLRVSTMRASLPAKTGEWALGEYQEMYAQVNQDFEAIEKVADFPSLAALRQDLVTYDSIVMGEFRDRLLDGDSKVSEEIRREKINPAADALFETLTTLKAEVSEYGADTMKASRASANRSIVVLAVVALAGSALSLFGAILVARRIVRNVQVVRGALISLAEGDLTTSVDVTTQDEIGDMAAALNEAQGNLPQILTAVVDSANESVRENTLLSAASAQVSAAIVATSEQAAVVAEAANEVSSNVQTVAAGSEQMSASIREIAQNAQEAATVARGAAQTAEAANVTVTRLGDSSREIGDVIKAITSIAEQTNLLALNATIEAARAGEAGKGFAVVASEVKELAAESARAAEDVSRRVEAIQGDTNSAVDAINEISEVISSINNYQLTIASAVEEQTATTNEMSRSAAEAATGSSQIAENISSVATVVEESTAAIGSMEQIIARVNGSANELNDSVNVFRF